MEKVLERVTTKQAAKELNIGVDTLQYLMVHDQLPIGYAIKKTDKQRYNYVIYRGMLNDYKASVGGVVKFN